MDIMKKSIQRIKQFFMFLLFLPVPSFAAKYETLGEVAGNLTLSFFNLAKLITSVGYILGLGFFVGAIMKFKQHKDNPTQIPIGTPIAMVFIAVSLVFMPTILGVMGATLFGDQGAVAGPSGVIFVTQNTQ